MPTINFDQFVESKYRNPEDKQLLEEEERRLDAAVALMQARENAGLTQEQLAEKSKFSRVTISRIEKGRISPSFRTLGTLADAMGKKLSISFS